MSLHQNIMDQAYKNFSVGTKLEDFYDQLSLPERVACLTGNLNYQVENGGFSQWHFNGYSVAINSLLRILLRIGTDKSKSVHKLVATANLRIEDATCNCSKHDKRFVDVDFDDLDEEYYLINDAFMADVEMYLRKINAI